VGYVQGGITRPDFLLAVLVENNREKSNTRYRFGIPDSSGLGYPWQTHFTSKKQFKQTIKSFENVEN
jgi:hypothetical protein